jgi:two-component system KDP operon response regulator KdpE
MCSRITASSRIPVIFLSALAKDDDIVKGLNRGAVDYVTKPFTPKVLIARINAALRFIDQIRTGSKRSVYDDGYLSINLDQRRVSVDGEGVQLTAIEYKLLTYFCRNANRLLVFTDILENVWGSDYRSNTNYVHIYIWRLRQKIEKDPSQPQYLKSVSGIGYRFEMTDVA